MVITNLMPYMSYSNVFIGYNICDLCMDFKYENKKRKKMLAYMTPSITE